MEGLCILNTVACALSGTSASFWLKSIFSTYVCVCVAEQSCDTVSEWTTSFMPN